MIFSGISSNPHFQNTLILFRRCIETVIFCTNGIGIAIYDPQKNSPDRLDVIPVGRTESPFYDAENEVVYFSGRNDVTTTLYKLHANGDLSSYIFSFRFITSICRDGNRKLRLGTYHGTYFFDEDTQAFVPDTVARSYKNVIAMVLDNQGTLWKGTWEGLFAEDQTGNDHQITNQRVAFLLNYHNRYIVFGYNDKLHLLDLQSYYLNGAIQIRTLGYYDGYDAIAFRNNGASVDHEGYVWVAGGDRAIRFHPDEVMKIAPLQPQPPCLAAIYYANRNATWALAPQTASIALENADNYLRFDMLQASLSAPDQLVFRYKLNGYSSQWLTSREHSFVFFFFSFGKYQLEVQSSVDDGETWSESVFSPRITIKNPFLLTWLGLSLIFLGISGITALIIYFTRKIIIRKEEEKRQIEHLKQRAVRAKFIPHFTGNVLNSINYLISKNPDTAQRYISDFSGFSQQTLLNSDMLFRTIREELDYTELYLKLEKLRFEEKLEYEFSVDPEVDLQQTIPIMALQTFCENALKHGLRPKPEGGTIKISVSKQANETVLSVEDDGVGRKVAQPLSTKGTKEGLKIVQQQLDIFNKEKAQKSYFQMIDLFDVEGQAAGTQVELRIKAHR
jgi:two-component sensor histidine kinase